MGIPLITVICLCYNHAPFLKEAILSVLNQTYGNIQIIVVDDASTDNSVAIINDLVNKHLQIRFIKLKNNMGNCTAFNRGLALAQGKYIIDFATDDVMAKDRVERQVKFFEQLDPWYGVIFSDAEYINEEGDYLKFHYPRNKQGKLLKKIPEGDVYSDLLSTYFISPPTMMIKKEVLDYLGGYDEQLAYEDFDFWVRSSRKYKYAYQDECLTKVRIVSGSHSATHYKKGDLKLYSTYLVCKKAIKLNENENERNSLIKRVKYEIRHSVFSENFAEATLFIEILKELNEIEGLYKLYKFINENRIKLSFIRNIYLKYFIGK